MTDSDSQLMERFRDGDEEAFRRLVDRFQKPLINFFFRLTWDRFAAEDYAQEVFARLIRHRHSYKPIAKLSTYVFRIAKNFWIDRIREKAAAPNVTSLDATIREDEGRAITLGDTVEGKVDQPIEMLERKNIRERVKKAVSRLPEEQRLVFVLSENQGLKYADIAEVLEIPVGTVKSRMHAAVLRLREMLKDVRDAS
ncbi:MAG: RNA polymerase sigma factor [Planctomycetota bacterium]|jgi:RNA polymerase sigma-70 factor (ECF subfamily)